ncbi:histone-lysine N-methyltransferase SETD2 isoform X2 [Dermochelys coriacea]|uniref:histone-lysine N-methyltransferase SETD2 isoform X2 n=1 Tax=Dermochelys coriacea TaxID=27794 RepID=UPI0018E7DC16|nr:histone-lysine N-methyltransferase SETD2 isoform X2 [Dermochelys coriacea]
MGDFYDPEHPTPEEEENEGKTEHVQKAGFVKGPVFKGVASSRFLPKGTKTKVNLEEQGRQKVSFSFSLTKKTLQNRFLTALGNEKQNETQNSPATPLPTDFAPKIKMDLGDTSGSAEESSPPKPKVELGKIHFKKHLLSVTAKPLPPAVAHPPSLAAVAPAEVAAAAELPLTPSPPLSQTASPPAPVLTAIALPQPSIAASVTAAQLLLPPVESEDQTSKELLNAVVKETLELDIKQDSASNSAEEHVTQNMSEQMEITSQQEDSHIGKEEEISNSSKSVSLCSKKQGSKRKFSQSDATLLGSESDEDSIRTSSSQRSHELKISTSTEKERDLKKSSTSLKSEDSVKSSSRSKSDRDEKHSSHPKPERDSRYMSSRSRSDRDRRRSRSHSRSRSDRGSRTSSSYSRSERSHYYESDRRYHRSSPYRERTRYSRSYTDNRTRESSDSEDEYRRTHSKSSDSRRMSSHSSSYRDSRTSSYSKSDRDSKTESSYAETERRGKSSKSDRESKRTSESEASKRCSPLNELGYRRGTSHSKPDSNVNSSHYKYTPTKTSAPKSDKSKSSFCCTESVEEIKHQSNSLDLETPCLKSNELRMTIIKKFEREKMVSPFSQLNDSPTFKKLDEPKDGSPNLNSELIGNDCHDSIKEPENLIKVKRDQLRTYCPIELNINGSPEGRSDDLATFCVSKTEDIAMSSDDSLGRSEVSPLIKSNTFYVLPSNGFQSVYKSKEQDLDDSHIQSEFNSSFKEREAPVPSEQDEVISSLVTNVDHSEMLVKKLDDLATPCNRTKDSDFCYISDDTSPSLYHSEVEIEVESTDIKVTQETLMDIHVEPQTVTCDYENTEDQNSTKSACEDELYDISPSHELSLTVDSLSRDSSQEECSLEIKLDNEIITQQPDENLASKLGRAMQNESEECLQHSETEIIELDAQQIGPDLEKGKLSFKNEHSYYLEIPVERLEKEEPAEESSTIFAERIRSDDFKDQSLEVSVGKDEENESLVVSAFSEALFPSCDVIVTAEETETVAQAATCDSSGNTSEFISAHNNDYSDTAESESEQDSEESDTEDSDSDDSVPRNRLQSVVVVPKNSTLSMEESSPCSSRSSQGNTRYSDHWEDNRPESSKPYYEERSENTANKNGPHIENKCSPPRGMDKSPATSTELSRKGAEDLQPDISQPQSDGVDSTSQTDLTSNSNGKPNPDERILKELMSIARPVGRQQDERPFCFSESFESAENKSRHQMHSSKPDSRQGKSGFSNVSGTGEFSKLDGFHSTEDLGSLGWDFSQPEKPSSTYQQPDSSYGMYSGYICQQGSGSYSGSQNYWQGNGCWDPRPGSRPSGINYERIQGQVPDSLTEDHEEYEQDDNWVDDCKAHFPSQSSKFHSLSDKEKGSVQAHEISSNSAKEPTVVNEKKEQAKILEKTDVKERGPPKKRRQELESDSESDGDPRERKKVKTVGEGEQSESLPQGSAVVRPLCIMEEFRDPQRWKECAKQGKMPCYFDLIEENVYLTERKKNKSHRDIKRMQCECPPLSKEERAQGEVACGEDCLNRLLMIECSSRCPNGDYCSNRRFQRKQHADVEVILTEKKGWGLRAAKDLPSNTFVLEYCGEVLDHKEFKARVKEYARSKNIHYYFMALKNDEIIDATQKGNCSRFMNHSCEPNCETQKWTVNGQLRVGFFTTKLVPSGSELTFDYQFQRYGKEAQKCFCGSTNCRGYLGGENRVSIRAAGGKMKKERSRKKDSVDGELEALLENGEGLSDKNQVLSLSRLMVRIETLEQKLTCLKLIQNTHSQACLKSFLECHGLSLLWIWMAELGDGRGNSVNNLKLQLEIMKTLELLPIPNKNMLEESKVLPIIQRWAQTKTAVPQLSEGDGYSSENTSRAHTPLNTPDPSIKQSTEGDTDTPKKLVFRRLKIISENSMDSAISDTTSELEGKEGKEDLDQLDSVPAEVAEEQPQQEIKAAIDAAVDSSKPQATELEAEPEAEAKESNGTKLEEPIAMETPSQDEEEGVSDVESERSQEQTDKIVDMSDLATKLLDCWKDLKEVYRIPKKSQAEKENSGDRGRDAVGHRDQTATPKNPNQSRERDPERQSQSKEKKKRRESLSPPSSAYERGTKRQDDRYDTPASSKKKVRLKDRNKLSTEERRKLFEQEVAQREAQKQQQQLQNLGMTSPLPYDSMGYSAPHHSFIGYPPGYPMQAYVDPSNPNAGKVLLPTPSLDPMCSPAAYEHPQTLVGHTVEPPLTTPQPVPVVQHVATTMEVSAPQYVAQSDTVVHQEPNVAVLPVPAPGPVQGQSYGVWDSNQQTVAVQQQYSPAQSQPTIYYPGQTCQTVYGVTSPYSQTTPPIVQSYAQPGLQYIQGQQIYTAHPQGVVVQPTTAVTTIVAAGQPQPIQQPELVVTNNLLDLPPPSPPKPKTIVLPPNWKTARDPEGKIYYYHVITRQTQWDPPTWDSPGDDASLEHEAEMDLGTPTYDENPMKDPLMSQDGSIEGTPNAYKCGQARVGEQLALEPRVAMESEPAASSKKPKTAEADTSSELAKKSKEVFRKEMSQFIVQCLNPYRKPDCKVGRITTTEDFKHLARKLTHGVMNKELKYCKNPEDLECNENVKHKTKEYIKKYMQKFGAVYKPKEDTDLE